VRGALVALTLVALAGGARAVEPAPMTVALSLSACAGEAAVQEQLVSLLRIELASTLAQPIALSLDDPGDASYRLILECTDTRDVLDLQIARRAPPVEYHERVSLVQLPERMRPRTVALAISEDVRWLDESKVEAKTAPEPLTTPQSDAARPETPKSQAPPELQKPPVPLVAQPAPVLLGPPTRAHAGTPLRDARTLRLTRNITLGLGISGLGLLIIGAPIAATGGTDHDAARLGAGAALTTLAAISLAGASVSFAFWLRERRRPVR
jgi:hypothetical protein